MNFQLNESILVVLQELRNISSAFVERLLLSFLLIIIVLIVRFLFLRFLKLRVRHGHQDMAQLKRWRLHSLYIVVPIIAILLLPMWAKSLQGIMAFLGLFGAGVLIVFKEIILNAAGWMYLVVRRPFDVGNRIIMDGMIGDVFEIRLLDFSMIEVQDRKNGGQSTGRVIHVPNSMLFIKPTANASKQFAFNWNEIPIALTLESDWQRAEKIILEVATEVSEQISRSDDRLHYSAEEYAIQYSALTPKVYVEYHDGQIVLILRHLTEPRQTRIQSDQIWRELLKRFKRSKNIQWAGDSE